MQTKEMHMFSLKAVDWALILFGYAKGVTLYTQLFTDHYSTPIYQPNA
jgi:hypothetical protein